MPHFKIINYETQVIKLNKIKKPIQFLYCSDNVKNEIKESIHKNNFVIKHRIETVMEINVENPEIVDGIIPEIKFSDSIYLSKAITRVNPQKEKAIAIILNASLNDVSIEDFSYI